MLQVASVCVSHMGWRILLLRAQRDAKNDSATVLFRWVDEPEGSLGDQFGDGEKKA